MKTVRKILSPIVFLFWFFGLLMIPLGPMALILGPIMMLGQILYGKRVEQDLVIMTFLWFVYPVIAAINFIDGTPLD